jgi:hypothetical protein
MFYFMFYGLFAKLEETPPDALAGRKAHFRPAPSVAVPT